MKQGFGGRSVFSIEAQLYKMSDEREVYRTQSKVGGINVKRALSDGSMLC